MSSRPVAVVADSTLDIPDDIVARYGIHVVPLNIHFGDEVLRDHVDITSSAFLERLIRSPVRPTTSQPSPATFAQIFRALIDAGNDIICLTLSSGLSGTFNSARVAAQEVPDDRLVVVDTHQVSIAGGFLAIAAAEAAAEGAALASVAGLVESMLGRVQLFAALDTLEYLHKGGRIGRARMLVGSLLSIKPIVTVQDGVIDPVERVRTWRKAMGRLVAIAGEQPSIERLAVMHTGSPTDADALASQLAPLAPRAEIIVGELGPVVTTYAGPGLVGFAVTVA